MPGDRQALAKSFLDGGGELGALMRAFDWTKTPLGHPDAWPRSLKTAVRIMLTSRQPIWLGWGPELTYLYNDPYKSIIGGKHPNALGRPFAEVWREIWDVVGPMADAVMTQDEGTYVEAQLLIMERHGYQEETYYTFSYSPVPNDEGGPGGLICANTDDTPRVIGERQLALLSELAAKTAPARTWLGACELAIEAFKNDGHDITFSLIFASIDGGVPIASCSQGADSLASPTFWPCDLVMRTGQMQVVTLPRVDGDVPVGAWQRPATQAAVLPIAAPGGEGHAGVLVVGLNPFRKFDETYQSFLVFVARQVSAAIANAQTYEQEKKRAEALVALDQAKTAFFSNVSHEFRTPLTLMLGPLEDLLAKRAQGSSEDAALLEVVHRNGQRLLKLVNTLLDFARIEAGRAHASYEATDLGVLTTELASNFRSACERAGIRLTIDCPSLPTPAYVDREMWEKIVLNLLSNAFKFTLEGEITVRMREEDEGFKVTVSDTGTGIPAEDLPRMFERFHRVEGALGRSHEGSGIGLALVQELVKLHGGTISVASGLRRGTTFAVSIPKGSRHLPQERVQTVRNSPASTHRADAYVEEALSWVSEEIKNPVVNQPRNAPRVLLADDNADLREYAQRLLAGEYEVETVNDGQAALEAIRRRRPDIVVSDAMMPRLDGFGLIRELRADPELRGIPVILLSARAGEEARIEGLGKGADDYLSKPFSSRELLVRVGTLLKSATVHRRAQEALAQFETLLNRAPLGVYLVDNDFRIAAVNPVARPVFGDISDLVGRDFEEVIRILWPPKWAEQVVQRFRHTLETGEPYVEPERIEERLDRKVTEFYEWEIHRIALPGNRYGVVCYFRDISRSVMAREALRDADRRKDEFLATLSHELRNPLAPLRNSLQLLRLTRENDQTLAPIQELMERQVNHLVRLVDDLLEMSRINRGTFALRQERVELAAVVRNAMETSSPLIQTAEHELNVSLPSGPIWLNGDPVRLAQIVSNLLNNAALYTDRGGRISLEAFKEAESAIIVVRDNGRGIDAQYLESIFEMFSRGDNSSGTGRGQGGLGIGLSLARRLAQMHGGTISAASGGTGKGSTFTVRIPVAAHQSGTGLSAEPQPAPIPRRRVLVVDDNLDGLNSLGELLQVLGADVRLASSGAEALQTFVEYDPAIVLLDIGMPEMDGYEVARRIRSDFSDRPVKLIALTGWGQEEDRKKAGLAGFDHHLVKPAEISKLHELLL